MWRFTWNVPAGMKTLLPRAFAAAIVASNASEDSRTPVGSAPNARTESELRGVFAGLPTCSKSIRSMIVQAAFVPSGTETRTLSPGL